MYKHSGSSRKYIVSLAFALLMVLLILSAVNLIYLFQLKERLEDIDAGMSNLNAAIGSLNATVSNGSPGSRLVMIWNNSDVGFASPDQIGHGNYLPHHFSYDVSGFHEVYIYYWLASGSTYSFWGVYFSTDAFQRYVTDFSISSTDMHVLELDVQATYLNVSLLSYGGGVEGYLSLYLYLV